MDVVGKDVESWRETCLSNASSATDPFGVKLVELEGGGGRTDMNAEVGSCWAYLDIGPLWKVFGKPILEARDRGRMGINDRNDDTLVDLEVKVGKVSEEGEEFVVVVELDRVREDSTNVISTKTSGAPICAVCFL